MQAKLMHERYAQFGQHPTRTIIFCSQYIFSLVVSHGRFNVHEKEKKNILFNARPFRGRTRVCAGDSAFAATCLHPLTGNQQLHGYAVLLKLVSQRAREREREGWEGRGAADTSARKLHAWTTQFSYAPGSVDDAS